MARDLNDTLIFAKVVEHGSFISAARALRLPDTVRIAVRLEVEVAPAASDAPAKPPAARKPRKSSRTKSLPPVARPSMSSRTWR